jgi:hypothetical protein
MRFWQWERKTIWKVAGALGVLVAVLIIIDAVSPKADKPAPTPTATATATSAINEDLAAIAMDSGKYVEWFLSEAQPRCNRMHGRDNCQVALWEVVLAGPCGANLGRRLN